MTWTVQWLAGEKKQLYSSVYKRPLSELQLLICIKPTDVHCLQVSEQQFVVTQFFSCKSFSVF